MEFITVNCTVSLDESGQGAIKFTFEDIPFVIYFRNLHRYMVVAELEVLNFHVNDDRTICSAYDLKDYYGRRGVFPLISQYEDSETRTERIKIELANPALKLTAPRDIFMKFIKDTNASIDNAELQRLYPEEFAQFSNGNAPDTNTIVMIYEKKNGMFQRSGGRRKNGRHCRRTRQKTKRVKRAKLRKRSRKANHIKNVKH